MFSRISSLFRCIIFLAISLISYTTQPNAPQIDPQVVSGSDVQLYRKPDLGCSPGHADDHPATLQLSSPSGLPNSPPIVEHNSPLLARLALGLMAAVVALQFIFVVYSATRLQNAFSPPLKHQAALASANHVDPKIGTGGGNVATDAPINDVRLTKGIQ